jgi:hypothetical protein
MNNKTIWIALVVLVLIFGAVYYFSTRSDEGLNGDGARNPAGVGAAFPPAGEVLTINGWHSYQANTHVVAGELAVPTPCYLVAAEAMVAESFPEQVTIAITATEPARAEVCAQVITAKTFSVEFAASESATIRATVNGEAVTLNLMPVAPGAELDNLSAFEFKG